MDDRRPAQILLVDDDESHIELSVRAFEGGRHLMELTIARSLSEARRLLAQSQQRPSLLIIDLQLPDGSGMELVSDCRVENQVPVIVLTGNGDEQSAVAALKAGALDYFVKSHAAFADLPRIAERTLRRARDIAARKQAEASLKKEQLSWREANQRLRQALDELRQTQEQVVQQERMRALGQMASGAAHDLNNALSPVLGYSDMLMAAPELPPHLCDWVNLIRTGAIDAAAVVDRLRQFYKPQDSTSSVKVLDVNQILRQIPSLTRPKWSDEAQQTGRTITMQLDLRDVRPIFGNEPELRQVFTNLVLNAVDALPVGGCITLRSRATEQRVIVEVSDGGIGMTDDERLRCFEPFFTTKPTGSGLGLSVCHGILRRHQATIEVESVPAQGTTIRAVFPVSDQQQVRDRKKPAEQSALPSRRILYIDDDSRLRSVVAEFLRQLEQDVDLAEDGASGLLRLKQERYDVVITDLGMPEMDGREVTRTIRDWWPDVPVIMLTGWPEEVAMQHVDVAERPTRFLQKPPTLDGLRAALAEIANP